MIRQNDLMVNYIFFYIISLLGLLRFEFEWNTWKIRRAKGRRNFMWKFWFANGLFLTIFKDVRLVQSVFWGQYVSFHHICLHITMSLAFTLFSFWMLVLFVWEPDVSQLIFNQLDIQDDENLVSRRKYSIQEWLLVILPFGILIFYSMCFTGLYILDPTSTEFLYSVSGKSTGELVGCVVYEAVVFYHFFSVGFYASFVKLAFIQNKHDHLARRIELIESPDFRLDFNEAEEECDDLRRVQLTTGLFNKVYADLIFTFKVSLIIASTNFFYFGIRLFVPHPSFSFVFLTLGVTVTLLFVILYDKAFSLPEMFQRLKEEVWTRSQGHVLMVERSYVQRILRSVPNLGIKVGQFHTLSRLSTPIFIDFVIRQVVGLTVTFPK